MNWSSDKRGSNEMRISGMKTSLALLAVCIMAVSVIHLSGCSGGPTDAKGMAERSVKALGGLEKATGWKTSVSKGQMMTNWPGWGDLTADCTYFIQKPDMMVLDQDYSVYDHPFFFRYTYNAGEAWVMVNLSVRQNARYTAQLEKGLKTVDGIAYYLENADTLYIEPDVEPDSLLADVVFTRIAAIEGADTVFFDLDNKTWLPVRSLDKGDQGEWNHNIYDDFRPVNGYLVPFHETTYVNGTKNREMTWQTIEYNVEIDKAEFEKNRPKATE
jgi:hypothetical protein